ncbi:MAG TPA: hypothetical protein VNW94_00570 [Streptosporangiaceae bacterium]|nr:hypothetical protein [Streptosporangiaceae bacterium]
MSTFAYGDKTRNLVNSTPGSGSVVKNFVDTLTALVPAEVLVAHAVILQTTTKSGKDAAGKQVTTITDPAVLKWAFVGLTVLSVILYVAGRRGAGWSRLDFARAAIPPLAFVGWTMLQTSSAFDAIAPGVSSAARVSIAVIGAIALGALAGTLGAKAQEQTPPAA